jgi:hypothetical protein
MWVRIRQDPFEESMKERIYRSVVIAVSVKATKTKVLELAFDNLQRKRYAIDEIARKYNVDKSRLFVLF